MTTATQERLFQGRWPHCQHCEVAALKAFGVLCSDRLDSHEIACWCQSEPEWINA